LYVSPRLFRSQIKELRQGGYWARSYTPVELAKKEPGSKDVLITFDDGFLDTFEHALPVLQATGMKAIQFLVAGLLGKTNEWQQRAGDVREPLMGAEHVRAWLKAGQEIGAHTLTHPKLTQLPPDRARAEIDGSRKLLEDTFGIPIRHFCYPYGDWNETIAKLVEEAGYETACTTMPGVNTPETPRFALRRFTARYRSRNLKNLWSELRASVGF
jgi:peptidoglycan/xylan/chitin deacetylase (PgdA/CDA1 family)